MNGQPPVLIVGSGLAGWTVARELRRHDNTVAIHMVTADSGDFYAKPGLSNALAQDRTAPQLVTADAQAMAHKTGVTLHAACAVQAIDASARLVHTVAGPMPYRALVLATGASPRCTTLGGDASRKVLSVNSLADYAVFRDRLQALPAGSAIAILGAGLVGCEFANDLAQAGIEVHVVDPGQRPIAGLLPVDAGERLRTALESVGVIFHWRSSARDVWRNDAGKLAAFRLSLSNGAQLDCNLLLSAIGLQVDSRLAESAGLAYDRGILVDEFLRTNVDGIHALGDCARYACGRWLPFVQPLMAAARTLAARLARVATEPLCFPPMPVVIKTPVLTSIVLPPRSVDGVWRGDGPDSWIFESADGVPEGFVLMGPQTVRRASYLARIAQYAHISPVVS